MERLRIADLPSTERPRERLLAHGAKHLSEAELLAILLGTGQGKGKLSAVGLGQYLLGQLAQHQREPLDVLRQISAQELMNIPGIGPAKATAILAAIELGKRIFQLRPTERALVDSVDVAVAALSYDLMWQAQERFAVVMLDAKNYLIGTQVIAMGSATETPANPRDIFREAIKQGSNQIVVAHNHPTGNLEPSPQDLALTRHLLRGAKLLDITLLDHLILGNGDYYSLRETTTLWEKPENVLQDDLF